jgi:hypothetical protein
MVNFEVLQKAKFPLTNPYKPNVLDVDALV